MTISGLYNGLKNAPWQSVAGYSGAAACLSGLGVVLTDKEYLNKRMLHNVMIFTPKCYP